MIPNSYAGALIEGLRDYLESAFTEVGVEMDWGDYGIINPSVNDLSGRIFAETIPKVSIDLSGVYYRSQYNITLEAFACHSKTNQAYLLGQDLLEFLLKYLIQSLRCTGITGTYRAIALNQALIGFELRQPPVIGYQESQGGLELIQVRVPFTWTKEI